MKKQIVFLCLLIVYLFPYPAFAARNIVILSDKNSIYGDDEVSISASVSGFITGEKIYIKGAFFKEGSTNYFGYTKNGDSWIKNSASSANQREVEIGNWDNLLNVKVDSGDAGFSGKGDYKFKLGFYYLTSGGNMSSINWSQNNISFLIDTPNPTFTIAPVAKSSSNSTKTSALVSIAPSPTKAVLSKNISNYPNVSKSMANFDKMKDNKQASQFAKIKPITENKTLKKEVLGVKEANKSPFFLFISGALLLIAAAMIMGRRYLKERNIL